MDYRLLADIIAVIHAGYFYTVVFGLVFILIGWAAGWKWTTNRWFRLIHLGMILGVIARSVIWDECPLTWWERDLRALAGQEDFEGSPIGWFFHRAIHPRGVPLWVFQVAYPIFAALVVASLWLAPVNWRGGGGGGDGIQGREEEEQQPATEALAENGRA